jgi:hypothetical protein
MAVSGGGISSASQAGVSVHPHLAHGNLGREVPIPSEWLPQDASGGQSLVWSRISELTAGLKPPVRKRWFPRGHPAWIETRQQRLDDNKRVIENRIAKLDRDHEEIARVRREFEDIQIRCQVVLNDVTPFMHRPVKNDVLLRTKSGAMRYVEVQNYFDAHCLNRGRTPKVPA